MFCATVSDGIRLKAWKTKPIRSRRRIVRRRSLSCVSSVSPSVTVPDVGRSSPAATCRNVLLPDPDGPMIAVNDRAQLDADPVERDDGAVALAVDLADLAQGDCRSWHRMGWVSHAAQLGLRKRRWQSPSRCPAAR